MPEPFADTTDALGRRIVLPSPPQRIISLVPSLTDLLHRLELDDEVVGLTRFCERPEGWREAKTIVGGTKQVDAEQVAAMQPDLILANQEENTKADVQVLSEYAPVYVTDVSTVDGATAMIRRIGALVDRADVAQQMALRIAERFAALPAWPLVRAAYLIWRDPYMTVGGDTFIGDVMRYGGFTIPWEEATRYPEVTLNDLSAADLDVILCSTEPFPFHQKDAFTDDLRAACPNTPVHTVNGQLFSWYGPRLLDTPAYLRELRATLEEPSSEGQAASHP